MISAAHSRLAASGGFIGGAVGAAAPLLALAIFSASRLLPYKDTLIYVRICILLQRLCLGYKDDKRRVISVHSR